MVKKEPIARNIFEAARRNDIVALNGFLAQSPDLAAVNEFGFTALHEAAVGDNCGNVSFDAIKLLIEAGSPINFPAKNETKRTPLYLAAEFSQTLEPVKYLVEQGAEANIYAYGGRHIVENAMSPEVQAWLSEITGFAIPEPPPPDKYDSRNISTAEWKNNIAPALKHAFASLTKAGIFAVQGVGYTQHDGLVECFERLEKRKDASRFHAYCFYTPQDRSSAKALGSLYLGWGITHDDNSRITAAAEEIITVLCAQGLETEWNGSCDERIRIWLQPLLE